MGKEKAPAYLVNTWGVGGPYGTGDRCSLKYTRQLIDAIHDGTLASMPDSDWEDMPIFGLKIPKTGIKDVPKELLRPEEAWAQNGQSIDQFQSQAKQLAGLFQKNFVDFADKCSQAVRDAGPKKHQEALRGGNFFQSLLKKSIGKYFI